MKNLLCLLTAIAGWHLIEAMSEKDAVAALETFGDKCDPKPTEEDYKAILRNSKDAPMSAKCVRLCLMNQMEMLKDNCKLDVEKLTDITSMMFEGKEAETQEVANICNEKVNCVEKCSTAHDQAMCVLDEFTARKWPIPELDKDE